MPKSSIFTFFLYKSKLFSICQRYVYSNTPLTFFTYKILLKFRIHYVIEQVLQNLFIGGSHVASYLSLCKQLHHSTCQGLSSNPFVHCKTRMCCLYFRYRLLRNPLPSIVLRSQFYQLYSRPKMKILYYLY